MTTRPYADWIAPIAASLRETRARALELARTLADHDLARPTGDTGWTVHDELAHIAAAGTDVVRVLGPILRGEPADTSVFADIDARNARNLVERRGLAIADIAGELETSTSELEALFAQITAADERRVPVGLPFPLGQMITGYATHDPYHLGQVEAALAQGAERT